MTLPTEIATLPSVPDIETLRSYKSIYALCTVKPDKALQATHYVCVLIGGPSPIWGCWTVGGRFLRFFGSRAQIERAYPSLVWRRKMATWNCVDVTDKSVGTRKAELETIYGKRITK